MTAVVSKLRELFEVDLRSLALFRIGLGVGVLCDVSTRAFDLVGLYTDQGVLPRNVLVAMDGRAVYLSAHYWASAQPAFQAALFSVTAAIAVLLLLGWRTRFASLACWYLVSSVQVRQPLAYIAGDSILRLLLFWGLFLPLGARYSLDAHRGRARERSNRHFSGATIALLLQVCLIYWATGLRKTGVLWWSGQAVYYALQADEWATPLGIRLRDITWLLPQLTYSTLFLELFGPFLAFMPICNQAFRLGTVLLFWLFHASLAIFMDIGLFPLFSMIAWLPFLPAQTWHWLRLGSINAASVPDARSRLASVTAIVLLAYVVVLLAERTAIISRVVPEPVLTIGKALRLQQAWGMFAPDPPTVTARHELQRTLSDGSRISQPAATSIRWTVYLYPFRAPPPPGDAMGQSLRHFGEYHCKHWNKRNNEFLDVDRLVLVAHVRRLGVDAPESARPRTLLDVRCR